MGNVYGESADRPENTRAQHRWIHGEAQYEGLGHGGLVEGCVLRPPSEPSPPCSHIVLVSPLAPSLSLQLAYLGGRVDGPGVPPAKTQARKSFQKSNKFTKIENNYSRVSGGL